MKSAPLAALSCLILALCPRPCAAALLPGDIALTRIQGDTVSILALRSIPAGEEIRFTDDDWVFGAFDGSGASGSVVVPPGGLQPGDQYLIQLADAGIALDWGDSLHFYQTITPPFSAQSGVRHLLLVELNEGGLRWRSDMPDGLIEDVTHIALRQQFSGQGMDHVIREELLNLSLTPYKWLSALGSFRSWVSAQDYTVPIPIGQWPQVHLDVQPSPGMISLPFLAQNYPENKGPIHVPVRRSFGSDGPAAVNVSVSNQVAPFERFQNETISGRNMDLTDVAYGPGTGFVAVSPNSGTILINGSGNWEAFDTNDTPGENLQLSGILHNGIEFLACSRDGRIHKSSDGRHWVQVFSVGQSGAEFFRIHHLPAAGFPYVAVGKGGLCAVSANGINWSLSDTGGNAALYGAAYFNGSYVLCGEAGLVLHASQPAGPWTVAATPTDRTLYSMATASAGGNPSLLAVGESGEMLKAVSLANGFIAKPSNTGQTLIDVMETSRNNGADKYVIAVGANGVAVVSENGAPFTTRRWNPRAPALYALAQDPGGAEPVVVAVGEYGSLVRFIPTGSALSGSTAGINLNGAGGSVGLVWNAGDSSEKYITFSSTAALTQFRERVQLMLNRPASPGSNYRLGNDQTEINFFRGVPGRPPGVADNFGPLLDLTDIQLQVASNAEWTLAFRIRNSSNRPSQPLFLRLEGTNLPDLMIPDLATAFTGSRLGPLELSGVIQLPLRQPVESVSLYEVFRPGEEVLKEQVAINSLVADPDWVPNGVFPRSLGAYLKDNGSLDNPGIPGIGNLLLDKVSTPLDEPAPDEPLAESLMTTSGSGFVFSGTAPTPPANNPGSSELVLLDVNIGGPTGMNVRTSYNYFLVGTFYNTGTGLIEDYTLGTVDWEVTQGASPAVGLSIVDDLGTFQALAYPGVAYPRSVSIDALTTEGAPLDGNGDPVAYSDAQGLVISEPASYRTYAEWVASTGLSGAEDDEDQDPDLDRIVNLLEFVFDQDPEVGNPPGGTSSSYDPDTGAFTFSFTIPKDLSAVTLKIVTTDDLSDPIVWTEQAMTLESSDSVSETWSTTVTLGTRGFGRLVVETYTP